MAALSATGGKGVMMFAQRRQRLDQIALEQEELWSRAPAPEVREPDIRDPYRGEKETYVRSAHPAPQQTFVDTSLQPTSPQQENIPQMTNRIPEPKASLVPNRTARPFGFINTRATSVPSSVSAPLAKKLDMKFKVAVPIHTSAQVWSPTGDIIASRDERISVPAKNAGILPESKKRAAAKQLAAGSSQNKGDRKSYVEPEEDFFSLGAEACNFMQPRSVKLKIPPPVAPKPVVDPNRKPWLSPPSEPFKPPRSPVSPAFPSAASGPRGQPYAAPQDWAQRQKTANSTPLQPTGNSWSAQPAQQSPVSIKAVSPAISPAYPLSSSPWNKPNDVSNSTASCPPPQRQPPKDAAPSAEGQGLGRAPQSQKAAGAPLMGRGAELFAKRQSRMEKFVVDADTVQANRARSASPTASLPKSWRYSSNIRAPPPLSYNPILAPFYPPAATKQPPSTSPKIKGKNRDKPKPPQKHLNSLDVMKHQPYQLDSSLFRYQAVPESPSPKPSPSPAPVIPPVPKPRKPRSAPPHSLAVDKSDGTCQSKSNAPSRSPAGMVSSLNPPQPQRTSSAEPRSPVKQPDAEPAATSVALRHAHGKPAPRSRPLSMPIQQDASASLALFTPASLIARGARQMAPKPRFSAKKPVTANRQWRPVSVHL